MQLRNKCNAPHRLFLLIINMSTPTKCSALNTQLRYGTFLNIDRYEVVCP